MIDARYRERWVRHLASMADSDLSEHVEIARKHPGGFVGPAAIAEYERRQDARAAKYQLDLAAGRITPLVPGTYTETDI